MFKECVLIIQITPNDIINFQSFSLITQINFFVYTKYIIISILINFLFRIKYFNFVFDTFE